MIERAFPQPVAADSDGRLHYTEMPGMSLRAYFAAHAPEVPHWFEHVAPAMGFKQPPTIEDLPEELKDAARDFLDSEEEQAPAGLEDWFEARKAGYAARAKWQSENHMARLTQWRWAYADAMMKRGGQ
jgi:hypothetical protein